MFNKGTYAIEIDTKSVEAGFNRLEQRLQRMGVNLNTSVNELTKLENKFRTVSAGATGSINGLVSTIHNLNRAMTAINRQSAGNQNIIKNLLGNFSPASLEKLPGRIDRLNNSLIAISRIGPAVAPGLQTITAALNTMATAITTVDIRLGSVLGKLSRIPSTSRRIYSAAGVVGERAADSVTKQKTGKSDDGIGLNSIASVLGTVYFAKQVTTSIVNVGKALIDTRIQIEKYTNTFKAVEGTTQGAVKQLEYVRNFSKEAGLNFENMAASYSKFLAAGKLAGASQAQLRETFEVFSKTGQVLGLSGDEMSGAFLALQQMISKGKVSSEELRLQLAERIPGAMAIAARAMGMSGAELNKALEMGLIQTKEFLPAFTAEVKKAFGPSFEAAANSTIANVERMKTAFFEFKELLSEGVMGKVALNALKEINEILGDYNRLEKAKVLDFDIKLKAAVDFDEKSLSNAEKIIEIIKQEREKETYLDSPQNVKNLQSRGFGPDNKGITETMRELLNQYKTLQEQRKETLVKAASEGMDKEGLAIINKSFDILTQKIVESVKSLDHFNKLLVEDSENALKLENDRFLYGSNAMKKLREMEQKMTPGIGKDKNFVNTQAGLAGFGKEETAIYTRFLFGQDKEQTQLDIIRAITEAAYKDYQAATDTATKERIMAAHRLPFNLGLEAWKEAQKEMTNQAKLFDRVEYFGEFPISALKDQFNKFKELGDTDNLKTTVEQYSKQLEGLSLNDLASQVDRNLPKEFIEAYREAFEDAIKVELDKDLTSKQLTDLQNTRSKVYQQIGNTRSQDINLRRQEQYKEEYSGNLIGAIEELNKTTGLNRDESRDLELVIKDMISEANLSGMNLEGISKIADFLNKSQKTKDSLVDAVNATGADVYTLIDNAKAGTLNKSLAIKAAEEQIADLVDKQLIDYNEYRKMTDKLNSLKGDGLLKTMKERELLELQKLSLSQLVDLERQRREMGDVEGASLAGEAKGRKLQSGTFDSSSFTAGMKDAVAETQNLNQVFYEMGSNTIGTLNNGFTEMYQGIIDGSKSAGESFRDLGNLVISQMLAMLTQALIVGPLINAALGMAGGFAGAGAGASAGGGMVGGTNISGGAGVGIGVAHTGGIAGQPTFTRMHTGGMVSGDEVPIIAKSGEKVVSQADQMKDKQSMTPTFINIVDPVDGKRVIAENPDAIINVIAQNKNKIKNLLR